MQSAGADHRHWQLQCCLHAMPSLPRQGKQPKRWEKHDGERAEAAAPKKKQSTTRLCQAAVEACSR